MNLVVVVMKTTLLLHSVVEAGAVVGVVQVQADVST